MCWPGRASARAGSPTSPSSSSLPTCASWRPTTGRSPTWRRWTSAVTSSSPGTAPPRVCACPTPTGSPTQREGLVICDATSAVFAMDVPMAKLDVVTYSWQKVLGGEGQHGMLILSPRAVERLESYAPPWPLPKIFRMTKGGKLVEAIFKADTINTPSMLCVEDALDGLRWAEEIGGLPELIRRSEANLAAVAEWVAGTPWVEFLAEDPADPIEHLHLPQDRRPLVHRLSGGRAGGKPPRRWPRCWRPRGRPTTSPPTATRPRDCACGAGPPSHAIRPGGRVPLARLGLRGGQAGVERPPKTRDEQREGPGRPGPSFGRRRPTGRRRPARMSDDPTWPTSPASPWRRRRVRVRST